MWTNILYGVIIFLVAMVVTMYQLLKDSQKKVTHLFDISNNLLDERESLKIDLDLLDKSKVRWQHIAQTFHSRVKNYSIGITRFKRPDTDIRVLQVYARDELAIELQKDGLITYKMSEHWREDLKETEVKVTASINVNKIK